MRLLLRTACAVALVACSDAKSPTVIAPPPPPPTLTAAPAAPHFDSSSKTGVRVDPRSIPDRLAELLATRFAKVVLPADGFSLSPDAVHPDVACQDVAWNGARCWLMYTPYKNSDASFENPGFLMATNDTTWVTPPAVKNPIVPYPGIGAYNSDPDHAFDPVTKRLTQVYRVVADSFNKIMIMSTTNAKTWTTARVAFQEKNHDAISPSIVIDASRAANLWYVRSGPDGCNAKSSTIVLRTAQPDSTLRVDQAAWSAAKNVDLAIPNSVIWHLDVAPMPRGFGYVALVVAYTKGNSCAASDLWLATSVDGLHWRTFAMPLMWRGMQLARKRNISTWYRGTIRYDAAADCLNIWPSGLAGQAWTIYHTSVKLADVVGLLTAAQPNDLKAVMSSQLAIRATMDMP